MIGLALFSLCTLFPPDGKGPAMHSLFHQASALTHEVIGAAIEVHKNKGPGLLESIYEWCLTMELELRGHRVVNQLLSYMKLLDTPLGLIINFNELKLTDGVSRVILPGANLE